MEGVLSLHLQNEKKIKQPNLTIYIVSGKSTNEYCTFWWPESTYISKNDSNYCLQIRYIYSLLDAFSNASIVYPGRLTNVLIKEVYFKSRKWVSRTKKGRTDKFYVCSKHFVYPSFSKQAMSIKLFTINKLYVKSTILTGKSHREFSFITNGCLWGFQDILTYIIGHPIFPIYSLIEICSHNDPSTCSRKIITTVNAGTNLIYICNICDVIPSDARVQEITRKMFRETSEGRLDSIAA